MKPPFEHVVAQHGATVLRVVRAVLGHADADDAWSEAFLAAMKAYPDLAPDATRASARRAIPMPETPDRPMPNHGHDHFELTQAVAALPTKQRQAVAYHYLAGLPYAEIAALLDSSAAAARRAAADGIATLRRTYTHNLTTEFADDHH
jgi:DNA-directed RNA polymerase specialized sigma24 family protein